MSLPYAGSQNVVNTLLAAFDLAGTFVFALSGATAAVRHRLDAFGILVLGFAAGNSGGIARDLMIGALPPAAISEWRYVAVSVLAGLIVFFAYPLINRLSSPVLLFDAAGLGLFCVAGADKELFLRRTRCRNSARDGDRNRRRYGSRRSGDGDPERAANRTLCSCGSYWRGIYGGWSEIRDAFTSGRANRSGPLHYPPTSGTALPLALTRCSISILIDWYFGSSLWCPLQAFTGVQCSAPELGLA